ncbi:MAG: GNAT family N-acetyltransferase [Eubacterium sp.]|nr:GNAT family N-acetyltransferase [Candidatus Colimonas fimequi]
MSKMASEIVKEHFDPLIGPEQNDYMIAMFQTEEAIAGQLEHGYNYYFVYGDAGDAPIGFTAFYENDDVLYLSKFYLYKNLRGQGLAHQLLAFVAEAGRTRGMRSIQLNVNRGNSAVQAYEAMGFNTIRTQVSDIGGGYVMDDYIMEYVL